MERIDLASAFAETGAKPLAVSPVALGIAKFGGFENKDRDFAQLAQYTALGGNFIDTALVYGRWKDDTQTSYSERIYGMWLKQEENHTRTVTATKGAHPLPYTSIPRVKPECIDADIVESLCNLGTDEIDLYFLHRDDESVPVSVIMDVLNRHAAKGELNLLGASNWRAERIYKANDYCVQHRLRGFDVSQICFNIMRALTPGLKDDPTLVVMTAVEEEIYRDLGMPVMAFSGLAGGFAAKYFDAPDSAFSDAAQAARMARIRTVCRDAAVTPTAATLGYLKGQMLTVIPVVSVSSEAQLADVMAHMTVRLTQEQIAYIDGK